MLSFISYILLYIGIGAWAFVDSKQRLYERGKWLALAAVFFGPITMPIYLAFRPLKEGEFREGGTGWNVLKNFALFWTITLFMSFMAGAISALASIKPVSDAEKAGAGLGLFLVGGILLLVWFIPMISAIVLGFFLKTSQTENGPTGPLKGRGPANYSFGNLADQAVSAAKTGMNKVREITPEKARAVGNSILEKAANLNQVSPSIAKKSGDGLASDDPEMVMQALKCLDRAASIELSETQRDCLRKISTGKDLGAKFYARRILNKLGEKSPMAAAAAEAADQEMDLPLEVHLKKLCEVQSTYISLATIKKICESKSPEAIEPLKKYLQSCQDVVQCSYLTKMLGVNFPSDEMLTFLLQFLKHADERVVANTVEGIEAIQSPKAIAIFSQLLEHKNNRVRENATRALAKYDMPTACSVFSKMLSAKDRPHFVFSAIHAIKALNHADLLPLLAIAIDDDNYFVECLEILSSSGTTAINVLQEICTKISDPERLEITRELLETLEASH